jgi:magnesium-transporting ATPase (P-type)
MGFLITLITIKKKNLTVLDNKSSKAKLSINQIVFATITLAICGLIALRWGRQVFSTMTNRPGFLGTIHFHYNLTAFEFTLINLMMVIPSTILFLYQIKCIIDRNSSGLQRSFWSFGLLLILIALIQIILSSLYMPKG